MAKTKLTIVSPAQRRDKIEKLLTVARNALADVGVMFTQDQLHGYKGKVDNAFQNITDCLISYRGYNQHLKDCGK